ncbi:MAG TPA: response regulator [Capsulimonadaceae bacterium]|jgi:PAS domain S-box-containing protein
MADNACTDAVLGTSPQSTDTESESTDALRQRIRQLEEREVELAGRVGLLENVIERMGDGVVVADKDGKFIIYNPAAERIIGIGAKDIPIDEWQVRYGVYRPDKVTAFPPDEQPLARAVRGEEVDWAEMYVRNDVIRDGAFITLTARPLKDESGAPNGGVVVFHDSTNRKLAEAALAAERNLLRCIIDNIPDLIFVTDRDGRYIANNLAHLVSLGEADRNAAVGSVEADYVGHETAATHRAEELEIMDSGIAIMDREEPVTDAAGNRRWLLTTKAPLRNDDREIIGIVGISRDITEIKRAAEELEAARTIAEHATNAKSEFLANMSHEIRTPMNGIIGMTELALDTDLETEQREYLTMVKESASSLLSLLNDILDFSKIEAGRLEIDQIDFQLRDMIGDTMEALSLKALSKEIEIAYHVAPDVPEHVIGDPRRLRQVLVNLVGNAIKFTSFGEVVLDVGLEETIGDESTILFKITDTGIGIPVEHHARIFDAFSQVDSTTTRRFGGTGLGLSISSQLVRLMGGAIELSSQPGGGSTFAFSVKLRTGILVSEATSSKEAINLRGLPVLVVDDNATNRRILEEILGNWGMKPTVVSTGADALRAMSRATDLGEPFAVVLLDSMMPDVDGFMLVESIKQHPELTSATLMMLSSADRAGDAARCRQMGISSYLTKPIKQSTLFDAIVSSVMTSLLTQRSAPVEIPKTHTETVRPLNLLLAEDNAVNQRLAARILEKRGHTVTIANNGLEAVEAVRRERFDLIVMDVQMPEMDGLEATAAIRNLEKETKDHIPIVALTAHAMKGDRERCLDAGMDFYVSKPIQPQELIEVIDSLTSAARTDDDDEGEDGGNSEVFDSHAALDRVEGDQELLLELIELFFEQSPGLKAEIEEAVEKRDSKALQNAAHSLKGSTANFAATAAYEAALRLEMMGRGNDFTDADEAYTLLEREILTLTSALAAYRQDVLV